MRFATKKLVLLGFIAALAASCQKSPAVNQTQTMSTPVSPYTHAMTIGNNTLYVQIASTPQDQAQGLSGRDKLKDSQGMLFDFGNIPNDTPFWMKDMNFALDFIWIKDGKVIGITPNVPAPLVSTPDNRLQLYYPPQPMTQVVEVDAGWTASHNVKVGDTVTF